MLSSAPSPAAPPANQTLMDSSSPSPPLPSPPLSAVATQAPPPGDTGPPLLPSSPPPVPQPPPPSPSPPVLLPTPPEPSTPPAVQSPPTPPKTTPSALPPPPPLPSPPAIPSPTPTPNNPPPASIVHPSPPPTNNAPVSHPAPLSNNGSFLVPSPQSEVPPSLSPPPTPLLAPVVPSPAADPPPVAGTPIPVTFPTSPSSPGLNSPTQPLPTLTPPNSPSSAVPHSVTPAQALPSVPLNGMPATQLPPLNTTPSPNSLSLPHPSNVSSQSNFGFGQGVALGVGTAGVLIVLVLAVLFLVTRKKKKKISTGLHGFPAPPAPPRTLGAKPDARYYTEESSNQFDAQFPSQPFSSLSVTQTFGSHDAQPSYSGTPNSGFGNTKISFTYEEVSDMTHGFSQQNILGEGGFGCVYKGWMLDGREAAVKQPKGTIGQGEREFRAEIEVISRVHHRHLVSLIGYCISEHHRLLVYEFVPNGTLAHHLHGKGVPVIDWPKRLKIAIGTARGLAYLHEDCHPRIIHRDIKSANILLDLSFEAQVADFGLAKLRHDNNTHVSTRVMGTFGYMAPEYASSGKLTDKSDVFSFGVVLLELITGRKPIDTSQPLGEESLVEWARPLLNQAFETGNFDQLVDPKLGESYDKNEMFRMLEVAAACVRHSSARRPRMVQVMRALDIEAEMSDLSNGVKIGDSTLYDSSQYSTDIDQFRRMAFGTNSCSSDGSYTEEYASSSSTQSDYPSKEFQCGQNFVPPAPVRQGSASNRRERNPYDGSSRGLR